MNVSGCRQKLFGLYHSYRLFAHGGGGLFKVELPVHGNHKYEMFAGFPNGHERFEYAIRIFAYYARHFRAAHGLGYAAVDDFVRYFLLIEHSQCVCFVLHFCFVLNLRLNFMRNFCFCAALHYN